MQAGQGRQDRVDQPLTAYACMLDLTEGHSRCLLEAGSPDGSQPVAMLAVHSHAHMAVS